jgi:hypothetical protein
MPSLVEMAKANNTSKRRKQQHSPWAIGGAALSGAGALGAAAYGLRRGHKRRLDLYQRLDNFLRDQPPMYYTRSPEQVRAMELRESALQRMANPE